MSHRLGVFALGLLVLGTGATFSEENEVFVWTGAGKDARWSTPENWQGNVAPHPGSTLLFDPTSGEIVTENDRDDFEVSALVFSDGQKVTLNGRRIRLTGTTMTWSNECVVVCKADLAIASSGYLHVWGNPTDFNGDILIEDGVKARLGDGKDKFLPGGAQMKPTVRFFGDVNGPNATLESDRGGGGARPPELFYGSLNVACYRLPSGGSGSPATFYNPVNACTNLYGSYNWVNFEKPYQFPTSFCMTCYNQAFGSQDVLFDADQTIRRLETTYPKNADGSPTRAKFLTELTSGSAPVMLTILGDVDHHTAAQFENHLSLTWDPVGDYVFSIYGTANTTDGSFFIRNGALQIRKDASFTALSRLVLANAARLIVDADAPANCFGATPALGLEMSGSAKLELSNDITVNAFTLAGVPQAAKTYRAADLPGVLTGEGSLTVLSLAASGNVWTNVSGGDWSEPGNWSGGVPGATPEAQIVRDGSYAVAFDVAEHAGDIRVAADGNPTLTVGQDAAFLGKVTLGDGTAAGTLLVTNGTVASASDTSVLTLNRGGRLEVTGGTFLLGTKNHLDMKGGDVVLSGTGKLQSQHGTGAVAGGDRAHLRSGRLLMSGNSEFVPNGNGMSGRYAFSPVQAGQSCEVIATDNAYLKCEADMFAINSSAWGTANTKTTITLDGSARAYLGRGALIASGNGSMGELVIRSRAYAYATGYTINIGGNTATDPLTPARGTLRVEGGAFYKEGSYGSFFAVGSGIESTGVGAANLGWLYLSGGAITNSAASSVGIGVSCARGVVRQTGGKFISMANKLHPMVLGCRGGEGEWTMTGGSFSGVEDVYVGGVTLDRMDSNFVSTFAKVTTPRPGVGRLAVTGGTFETTGDLWVSQDGQGALELGAEGEIRAKDVHLTASNSQVDPSAHFFSSVRFRPGLTSGGRIVASGKLSIADDARLDIDLSDCDPSVRRFVLMTFAAREGSFAKENIRIVGTSEPYRVVQSATRLTVAKPTGVAILLR